MGVDVACARYSYLIAFPLVLTHTHTGAPQIQKLCENWVKTADALKIAAEQYQLKAKNQDCCTVS